HLTGEWRFKGLGEEGSKVMLSMNFDFSSSLISSAFRRGFVLVADRLIYDFGQRADAVYGL
ncbi:MAG: ubiquinone-binding protein, partial [Proteobacteria bacterium]|nr:ubiquinone-binding protein [Pseudomonadota bacterium]